MEGAFTARRDQTRSEQAIQMVAERRCGDIDARLDVAGARAPWARLHQDSQDGETQRVTQRLKLFGMSLELADHVAASSILEVAIASVLRLAFVSFR